MCLCVCVFICVCVCVRVRACVRDRVLVGVCVCRKKFHVRRFTCHVLCLIQFNAMQEIFASCFMPYLLLCLICCDAGAVVMQELMSYLSFLS